MEVFCCSLHVRHSLLRARRRRRDLGKLIADETEKWGKVIRAANITNGPYSSF
jgi:hypothetical protein